MKHRLAVFAFGVLAMIVTFAAAPAYAVECTGDPRNPAMALSGCDNEQAADNENTAGSEPQAEEAPPPVTEGQAEQDETAPKTAAQEWAEESASSAGELALQVEDQFNNPPTAMSGDYVTVFSFTFAVGLVIFAFTMIIQFARASRSSPAMRDELRTNLPRFLLYVPAMMATPGLVYMLSDFTHQLSGGFVSQAGSSFGSMMGAVGDRLSSNPFSAIQLLQTGPVIALVFLLVFIVTMIAWLIMDITSVFGVYLLTVLVPISAALSLYAKTKPMLARIIGVLIGCALVPVVTRFSWWLLFELGTDTIATSGFSLGAMLKLVGRLILATSSPVMLSYVMPNILPGGSTASGGMGGSPAGNLGEMGRHGKTMLDSLKDNFGSKGTGSPGGAAATAGKAGGATKAAGALGPVGAIASAGYEAFNALAGQTKSSALGMLSAAGGGYAHDGNASPRLNPESLIPDGTPSESPQEIDAASDPKTSPESPVTLAPASQPGKSGPQTGQGTTPPASRPAPNPAPSVPAQALQSPSVPRGRADSQPGSGLPSGTSQAGTMGVSDGREKIQAAAEMPASWSGPSIGQEFDPRPPEHVEEDAVEMPVGPPRIPELFEGDER